MADFKNFFLQTNSDISYILIAGGTPVYYTNECKKNGVFFTGYFATTPAFKIQGIAKKKMGDTTAAQLGIVQDCKNGGKFDKPNDAYGLFKNAIDSYKTNRLFFVNSCNFGHHYSALFSRWAFDTHGDNGRAKVIINIDQHCDCNNGKPVDNGSWGNYLTGFDWSKGAWRAFVAVGTYNSNLKNICIKPKDSDDAVCSELTDESGIIENIKKHKEHFDGCDLYITLDRDVYTYTKTHFPAGKHSTSKVNGFLEDTLKELGEYHLVGADITGLSPAMGGRGAAPTKKDWEQELTDIATWSQKFTGMKV